MHAVVSAYQQLLHPLHYDVIADVPTAATPIVSALCSRQAEPQITPRTDIKDHGIGAKIDGVYRKGDLVVLIDDLITRATSKIEAIRTLESEGLQVRDVLVLIDRQQGGVEELNKKGYRLHSFTTMSGLAAYYFNEGFITREQLEKTFDLVKC